MSSATVPSTATEAWLALIVGNTRLHWGYSQGDRLLSVWHTPHLERHQALQIQSTQFSADAWQRVPELVQAEVTNQPSRSLLSKSQPSTERSPQSLWIASVVPSQTAIWANQRASDSERTHPVPAYVVERSQIPLQNIYPTLGIDRAINLLGAGRSLGWPVLVVDAGTALTFTAGKEGTVSGGAILPGMTLQALTLHQKTADLPLVDDWTTEQRTDLPDRWSVTTPGAIASGIVYGTLSTLQDYLADWWQQCPRGKVVLTGGDGPKLCALLQQKTPEIASRVTVDNHLMFKGIAHYRKGAMLLL